MRLPVITLLLVGLFSFKGYAQNIEFSGAVSGNTSWDVDTVKITGDVTVDEGVTLSIAAGTCIEFQDHYEIKVNGTLLAEGTEVDTIHFTVADTTGYHDNSHKGWKHLYFTSSSGSSKLSFCDLRYGKATDGTGSYDHTLDFGGAVHLATNNIIIEHCRFAYNTAELRGGALYYRNYNQNPLTLRYCTMEHNRITNSGVQEAGGAIQVSNGRLHLYNCSFHDNYSQQNGGAVAAKGWMSTDKAWFKIVNCQFTNNTARYHGGGVYIGELSQGEIEIIGTLITENEALNGAGGGLYTDNYGEIQIDVIQSTVSDNTSYQRGGGIGTDEDDIHLKGTLVFNNTQTEAGAYEYHDLYAIRGGFTSEGYNLISNTGRQAITTAQGDVIGTLNNPITDISGSSSPVVNGGVPDTSGLGLLVTDLEGKLRIYEGSTARIDIGALEYAGDPVGGAFVAVYMDSVRHNYATIGLHEERQFRIFNAGHSDLNIEEINAPDNFTLKKAGDAEFAGSIASFSLAPKEDIVIHSRFSPTERKYYTPQITISSNAVNRANYIVRFYGNGTPHPVKRGIIAESNWCSDTIYIDGNISIPDNVQLTICPGTYMHITEHFKINMQGSLIAEGTEADSIVFSGAISPDGWGGIRIDNGENAASGAMNDNDSSKFAYCRFDHGNATDFIYGYDEQDKGAALYINSFDKVKVSNCSFLDNEAETYGAAIYLKESHLKIDSCLFDNNYADKDGTIRCDAGIIEASNCLFINNVSKFGGVFDLTDYSGGSVSYCQFYNNDCFTGALSLDVSVGIIKNSVICNNDMTFGVCVYSYKGDFQAINNTVAYNTAQQGGAFDFRPGEDQTGLIVNNILYGNTVSNIHTDKPGSLTVKYSIVEGDLNEGFVSEEVIDTDPLFATATEGAGIAYRGDLADWSITETSPAYNTGTPDTTDLGLGQVDIDGQPRIHGGESGRIDMGAYEAIPGGLVSQADIDQTAELSVYPNPVCHIATVKGIIGRSEWQITDMTGQQLKQGQTHGSHGSLFIDVNDLPSGVFMLHITDKQGRHSLKIVK